MDKPARPPARARTVSEITLRRSRTLAQRIAKLGRELEGAERLRVDNFVELTAGGLTQAEIADIHGVSQQYVAKVLRREGAAPRATRLDGPRIDPVIVDDEADLDLDDTTDA